MRLRNASFVVLALTFVLLSGLSRAQQVRIPDNALTDQADLRELLEQGRRLETNERWNDALSLYEQALKDYPGRADLEQRMAIAKRHFSLARRYADASYVQSLDRMSESQTLKLYGELMRKIQSHYVHEPNWRNIVQQGVWYLETALTSRPFLDRNLPGVKTESLQEFRQQLRQSLAMRIVRSRDDAESAVSATARLAHRRLGLRGQAVILEFACGAVNSLDEYSAFLTPDQLADVMSQIEGNFVGLGIELKTEEDTLLIVNVIEGGPASTAGLKRGERIVEVDGEATSKVTPDTAAEMLRGPEGTAVEVVLAGPDDSRRRVKMTRRRVEVPSIESPQIVDADYGVAYLRLASFQKTTSRDLDAALWNLHRQGMRTLILDVRGNPGGLLPASVEVADRFVSRGVIVSTRGRSANEDFDYRAHTVGTWRVPLIVLIDGDSASASEIFAGAIRDHHRGTVMGERSFGKGSVQGIFHLAAGGMGIRLTTAKFYSPSGREISKNGVTPNIEVRTANKPAEGVDLREDQTLAQAVQAARKQLAQRHLPLAGTPRRTVDP